MRCSGWSSKGYAMIEWMIGGILDKIWDDGDDVRLDAGQYMR